MQSRAAENEMLFNRDVHKRMWENYGDFDSF